MSSLKVDQQLNRILGNYSKLVESNLKIALVKATDRIQNKLEEEIQDGGYWVYDYDTKYGKVQHTHSIDQWESTPVIANKKDKFTVKLSNNAKNPYSGKEYVKFLIGKPYNAADKSGLTPAEWNRSKMNMKTILEVEIENALFARKKL
jgi:primase-polymerase (primpol)-like protein